MNAVTTPIEKDLAAALDWWREAGVDFDFNDDATAWLVEEAPTAAEKPREGNQENETVASKARDRENFSSQPAKVERLNLLGDSPPENLEDFRRFWLEAPGLDGIGPRGRIASRGPANAELMILVVDPEEGDRDRLLSGIQGRLLARIITAMGLVEDDVLVASALPRHTPMADTATIARGGMDAVLAHHIALAAPKKIVALGTNILPLIGHDRTKDITSLREINHDGGNTPLLVNEGLDAMLSMPGVKARFWRRWMEWSP